MEFPSQAIWRVTERTSDYKVLSRPATTDLSIEFQQQS